jgi:hypothetical protein
LKRQLVYVILRAEFRLLKEKQMSSDKTSPIIGTWRLISAEDKDPNTGQWVPYTFGNPPDTPTPDEALAIFNAYIAYYGSYTVDSANVTVNVEGALDPSQVGSAQARPYELSDDDTLIIGDQVTYKRTLKRVK